MNSNKSVADNLPMILDIARLAPSVHNAQPWKVKAIGNTIVVEVDETHSLKYSDPIGRQTIISLGIFGEALILAASSHGWEAKATRLLSKMLELDFVPAKSIKKDPAKINSLKARCTDRSIYLPAKITPKTISQLEKSSSSGVTVRVITEEPFIKKIAELTAKGIGLALSSPDFRKELSQYLILPRFNKRGISVLCLGLPLPLAVMEPLFIRKGIGIKSEVQTELRRWLSASGIILITTKGDIDKDWLAAGRAYLRASLTAEQLRLAQATSAATVEASTFHEDVEELLGTEGRLQAVIRLGKSNSKKIYSPRVAVNELLAT